MSLSREIKEQDMTSVYVHFKDIMHIMIHKNSLSLKSSYEIVRHLSVIDSILRKYHDLQDKIPDDAVLWRLFFRILDNDVVAVDMPADFNEVKEFFTTI